MKKHSVFTYFFCIFILIVQLVGDEDIDEFVWLEKIESEKSLSWAEQQNKSTLDVLQKHPKFESLYNNILDIYNSDERIDYPSLRGEYVYHFLQDEVNKKGLWRKTTLEEYEKDKAEWESLLDIDSLSQQENESWVFKGSVGLHPEYNLYMIMLSRGGGDAVVIREFDSEKKEFVKDGFVLPEAKGSVSWVDRDTLLVSTNFGEGTTTKSGYSRIAKLWKRGQDLKDAKTLFAGELDDVGTWGSVVHTSQRDYQVISRATTFYTYERYVIENGETIKLQIPDDAQLAGFFQDYALVELKSDWKVNDTTYFQGALIALNYQQLLKGNYDISLVVEPTEKSNIASITTLKDSILINMAVNIRGKLYKYSVHNGKWQKQTIDTLEYGNISVVSADAKSDIFFYTYQDFLTPTSLYMVSEAGAKTRKIKSLPEFFPGKNFQVEQLEAISKDGTQIPYFIVYNKNIEKNGKNPTLLYGYGGFEISLSPSYSSTIGVSWLNEGGIYVLANIRGGGEFGPKWHHAALKENRQKAYDDFIAIAEDLIAQKFTSPEHLGIMGGSNGGLLVGVAFTQRPDLFNAVVCRVPLLDMKRFNKLLAGASWMGEYGNPDIPEEWAYIKKYSPYQNLSKDKKYPKVFFNTSTRDDRVHPGHARKMVAKMQSMEHSVFYYENMEGGHAAATTNEQRAFISAIIYCYLHSQLK